MRAMVFGDTASGKTTFAIELGELTNTPVIHLDQVQTNFRKNDQLSIAEYIQQLADKDSWIFDGNAFSTDPTYRLDRADKIFAFDFNPIHALINHVIRYGRLKFGIEQRIGNDNTTLDLGFYLPYIFQGYPPRKRAAIAYAQSLQKELVVFNQREQATIYLAKLACLFP